MENSNWIRLQGLLPWDWLKTGRHGSGAIHGFQKALTIKSYLFCYLILRPRVPNMTFPIVIQIPRGCTSSFLHNQSRPTSHMETKPRVRRKHGALIQHMKLLVDYEACTDNNVYNSILRQTSLCYITQEEISSRPLGHPPRTCTYAGLCREGAYHRELGSLCSLKSVFSKILVFVEHIPRHAGCTENDTLKMEPWFAHHTILLKKICIISKFWDDDLHRRFWFLI